MVRESERYNIMPSENKQALTEKSHIREHYIIIKYY